MGAWKAGAARVVGVLPGRPLTTTRMMTRSKPATTAPMVASSTGERLGGAADTLEVVPLVFGVGGRFVCLSALLIGTC